MGKKDELKSKIRPGNKKGPANAGLVLFVLLFKLGWLTGLEPATTGITILDSTN